MFTFIWMLNRVSMLLYKREQKLESTEMWKFLFFNKTEINRQIYAPVLVYRTGF